MVGDARFSQDWLRETVPGDEADPKAAGLDRREKAPKGCFGRGKLTFTRFLLVYHVVMNEV